MLEVIKSIIIFDSRNGPKTKAEKKNRREERGRKSESAETDKNI